MDEGKDETSESTGCAGTTADGGPSSDRAPLAAMLTKALRTKELRVEYKADLGRLRTCYLGAKKSRNRSLKQRFAVGLHSCQLKADHGLPKDSKDKITSRHTKNVACPEFLQRVTKAL